ncbi:MAG TPA: hypothetical protein VN253_03610 [Kofleriaceae bacterium]|nr:hypothetical protein [Kofleriaceae bacterium]
MQVAMLLALLALPACTSSRRAPQLDRELVDIGELRRISPPAARDLDALIAARRPQLSRCADPVRALVRQHDPGFGSVGVVVRVVGVHGRPLEVRSVAMEPRLGNAFDECVVSALSGGAPTSSSDDYAFAARLHLCVNPQHGAPPT